MVLKLMAMDPYYYFQVGPNHPYTRKSVVVEVAVVAAVVVVVAVVAEVEIVVQVDVVMVMKLVTNDSTTISTLD